ncbi:MAG: J domain-containing protein [Chloroflexi bacterium]|nr:J domain-containing protein [Chloroflexota bacterium]MCH8115007.1 J domain-containing protein [Chloroflexota bacterium]MCI0774345.1 J domain-containing protein [Chloroflexota bacterium]MCI0807848.1 J domain-containing protein [Chloroflexota bacterium]MCI0833553.1 J domain-containing protein [Chloroflexota bacterium]
MTQNYYDRLGVTKNASDKDIKAAYRRMARKLHPDVNPNDERAQEQFKKVNEAYEVVGNPAHRKDYDQFGDNWKHADEMRNMGAGPRGHAGGGMGFNLGDLIGAGAANRGGGGFGNFYDNMGGHAARRMRHEGSIVISLDEVYTGVTRQISIGSDGSGGYSVAGRRDLEVKIPKGVPDGRRIRLRPDENTEITLTVKVRSDKRFSRDGANLRADVAVPLLSAILGGEVEVPTMTGRIALQIPAGTQNGRSFKIRGKGLPKMNSDEFGDLFATIKIRLPESLTDQERDLYMELRGIRSGAAHVFSGDADAVVDAGSAGERGGGQ